METIDINKLSYEGKIDLASNNETSAELLAILAKDDEWRVREAVALNRNTPLNTLKILANDKEKAVRKAANKALNERKMNTKFNKER